MELAEEEIAISDKLLADRNMVLAAIPGCGAHGDQCVPHALEWIERQTAALTEVIRFEIPIAIIDVMLKGGK